MAKARYVIQQKGPKGEWQKHALFDGDMLVDGGIFKDEEDAGLALGHRRAEFREFEFRAVKKQTVTRTTVLDW